MSALTFPSPQAFLQSVRQRRRALPTRQAILIVEGVTDKRALFPFLEAGVLVIPSNGRPALELTYRKLETPLREGVLFILDCDGETERDLKGNIDLILTNNRDLEADLLFELGALDRIAHEYLAGVAAHPREVVAHKDELLRLAMSLSATLGVVKAAASRTGAPTRVLDGFSRQRRKIRLGDIGASAGWIRSGHAPTLDEMLAGVASAVGWTPAAIADTRRESLALTVSPCVTHASRGCPICLSRTHSNGHILVEAVFSLLHLRHGVNITQPEIDRAIRMAADKALLPSWSVVQRIERWELGSARRVIAGSPPPAAT